MHTLLYFKSSNLRLHYSQHLEHEFQKFINIRIVQNVFVTFYIIACIFLYSGLYIFLCSFPCLYLYPCLCFYSLDFCPYCPLFLVFFLSYVDFYFLISVVFHILGFQTFPAAKLTIYVDDKTIT